jgi:hypothetical protein
MPAGDFLSTLCSGEVGSRVKERNTGSIKRDDYVGGEIADINHLSACRQVTEK